MQRVLTDGSTPTLLPHFGLTLRLERELGLAQRGFLQCVDVQTCVFVLKYMPRDMSQQTSTKYGTTPTQTLTTHAHTSQWDLLFLFTVAQ